MSCSIAAPLKRIGLDVNFGLELEPTPGAWLCVSGLREKTRAVRVKSTMVEVIWSRDETYLIHCDLPGLQLAPGQELTPAKRKLPGRPPHPGASVSPFWQRGSRIHDGVE